MSDWFESFTYQIVYRAIKALCGVEPQDGDDRSGVWKITERQFVATLSNLYAPLGSAERKKRDTAMNVFLVNNDKITQYIVPTEVIRWKYFIYSYFNGCQMRIRINPFIDVPANSASFAYSPAVSRDRTVKRVVFICHLCFHYNSDWRDDLSSWKMCNE